MGGIFPTIPPLRNPKQTRAELKKAIKVLQECIDENAISLKQLKKGLKLDKEYHPLTIWGGA